METNARKFNRKFLVATFGLLLLLLAAYPHPAVAQTPTNTFPNSGNVGVGTTSPASILTVQTTGTDNDGDKYLRIKSTNSFSGLLLDPGQAGDAPWLVLGGYPNAGDFTVREYGVANYLTIKKTTGNVGIGTSDPSVGGTENYNRLTVLGSDSIAVATGIVNAGSGQTGFLIRRTGTTPSRWYQYIPSGSNDLRFYNGSDLITFQSGGNVGIGTASPTAKLHVSGSGNIAGIVQSTTAGAELDLISSATNSGSWGMGTGWASAGVRSFYLYDNVASVARVVVDASGNVGIGNPTPSSYKLDVNGGINASNINSTGNITAAGSIAAKYQDVAEWVPTSRALPAGTVVTLDPTKSNHVEASSQSYDTRVAGVVSEQPGITLGESGENKVLVATTGRVRVTVDASQAPIHIGDLLVTSDLPGVAMKSEPITIRGRLMHMPGTLIGKALEPLMKGTGEILVLLSLQ